MSKKSLIIIVASIVSVMVLIGVVVVVALAVVGARKSNMASRQSSSQTESSKKYEALNACNVLPVETVSRLVGASFKLDDRVEENDGRTKGSGISVQSTCSFRSANEDVIGSARIIIDSPQSNRGAESIKESFKRSMSNSEGKEDLKGLGEIAYYNNNTAYVFNKGYRYAVFVSVPEFSDEKVRAAAVDLAKSAIDQ